MQSTISYTPADRVGIIVSGNFTPDALGSTYNRILSEVRADPAAHLAAFEQLYLTGRRLRPSALGVLTFDQFLAIMLPLLPTQTRALGQRVAQMMDQASQVHESALIESTSNRRTQAIERSRQALSEKRAHVASVLRRGGGA